ncbi:hypothetical protein HY498_02225 [Candidatus Woesearchaeota archaeon]|nr:hypothetical protein [Candidatus Woesearchaeota archaeon]
MKPLIVKGSVQNYDNGRKKIEIKKEIRLIFDSFDDNETFYSMEFHKDIEKAIERLKQIYEETGQIPLLLNFRRGTDVFPNNLNNFEKGCLI